MGLIANLTFQGESMMLASRFFKITLLIVWILASGVFGIAFLQVYDAQGHGLAPVQFTSTSTFVTTLSTDDQFTVTNSHVAPVMTAR